MAILNSLKNIFNKNQQVSGGNSFEVSQKLKFQDEFNKATIPYVNNSIEQTLNEVFKGQNYNTFQLLNFQANYFCNRKIYVAENNNNLTLIIKHIIRQAFFNGTSAFYKDDLGIYRILYIHKVSHKLNGEVKEIEASYSSIDYDYSNMNNSEFFKDQKRIILKEKDLENLSIFYWND